MYTMHALQTHANWSQTHTNTHALQIPADRLQLSANKLQIEILLSGTTQNYIFVA